MTMHRAPGIVMMLLAASATLAVADADTQRGRVTQDFRAVGALKPGDLAPDFALEPRGGGPAVRLSSFRGKSPVALVFGSYT